MVARYPERADFGVNSFLRDNTTGADGRFKLEGVPAGAVVLMGYMRGARGKGGEWGPVSARADIPPAGEADVGDLLVAKMQTSFEEAGDLGFELKEQNPMNWGETLIVGMVDEGGPADEAGLRTGDQIVAVDGQDLTGGKAHLFFPLAMVPVGSTALLGLEGSKKLSITAAPRTGE